MILQECDKKDLDKLEQKYIELYRKEDKHIVYNVTIGSQSKGKVDFQQRSQEKLKRYKNGKAQGEKEILDKVKTFFDKYLDFVIKGKPTKLKERKLKEFEEFLNDEKETKRID